MVRTDGCYAVYVKDVMDLYDSFNCDQWHINSGNVVIPGSKNPDHIRDNFDIFDFKLTDEEIKVIAKVDKGVRYYQPSPELLAQYAAMELQPDL